MNDYTGIEPGGQDFSHLIAPHRLAPEQATAFLAEARKFDAEAEQALANARRLNAEGDIFAAQAALTHIQLEGAEFNRKVNLSSDVFHHIYFYDEEVNLKSVTECIARLAFWHRTEPDCDMEITIMSPGGSVIAGFALYDFIGQLRRAGHKITTASLGMAASMAATLLQAGDIRAMGKESWMLLHEGGLEVKGTAGQVEDALAWNEKLRTRIANVFVDRAQAAKPDTKLTLDLLQKNWHRADWWISASEALELGLVDEIR